MQGPECQCCGARYEVGIREPYTLCCCGHSICNQCLTTEPSIRVNKGVPSPVRCPVPDCDMANTGKNLKPAVKNIGLLELIKSIPRSVNGSTNQMKQTQSDGQTKSTISRDCGGDDCSFGSRKRCRPKFQDQLEFFVDQVKCQYETSEKRAMYNHNGISGGVGGYPAQALSLLHKLEQAKAERQAQFYLTCISRAYEYLQNAQTDSPVDNLIADLKKIASSTGQALNSAAERLEYARSIVCANGNCTTPEQWNNMGIPSMYDENYNIAVDDIFMRSCVDLQRKGLPEDINRFCSVVLPEIVCQILKTYVHR